MRLPFKRGETDMQDGFAAEIGDPRRRYFGLAAYNAWANQRVFDAAKGLSDTDYRRDVGVFFTSLHGTLNHLLVADLIWLRRITGSGEAPTRLDMILHNELSELRAAREALDARLSDFVSNLEAQDLTRMLSYRTITNPASVMQVLCDALDHVFNHQTHHRGQAHAILTRLTGTAPSLDLLLIQRELNATRRAG